MEVKLGTHVYFSVSMTTMNKWPQALFLITTSSLLKLAHHTMHGGETWYTCVFQRFHDNHEQMASGTFSYNYILLHFSNLQTMQYMEVKLGVYAVSMTTMNKNGLGHFLTKKDFFISQTCKLQCKKVTLRMHMHFSISMMTMSQK